MAVPVISSATFDAANYAPGATITATLVRGDTTSTSATDTWTFTATDNVTGESVTQDASLTVGSSVTDPTTVTVVSSAGRTITAVSDDGTTAVFTAIA